MKKVSIGIISLLLIISLFVLPVKSGASSNLVLASVEWVEKVIAGVNGEVTTLKNQVATQKSEIDALKSRIEALEKGVGSPTPTPTPTPPPTIKFPASFTTTKNNVTIHSGATSSYRVVQTVQSTGTTLKIIDQFTSSQGLWYRVEINSTTFGWVFSGNVLYKGDAAFSKVVTKTVANVRKGATTSYDTIARVSTGTEMKYLGQFRNGSGEIWYNVELANGQKGWILASLTELK